MSHYHHGNLRETLLCEAVQQLENVGPEKLSLRALARAVGVSQTAPYRHFKDKDALLDAMAESGFMMLRNRMQEAVDASDNLDEALIEVGVSYIETAVAYPAMHKLMFSSGLARKDVCVPLKGAADSCIGVLKELLQKRLNITDPDDEMLWYMTINAAAHVKGHTSMVLEGNYCHPATGEPLDIRTSLGFFLNCLNLPEQQ
ncbi:TetR family transcriptional regulator [Endozoicomonas sp. OPT23]|uniref:TetR/AcrR family transcriptional regulator n=1 Tax=Endozoicomonas sp. OPT23 TaxID=2072845 RepID=UPI00129ABB10|nr:TetR/AcrR family transcriptional regulator [Endozoicomonas sp. OPT23]MRI33476.1 TetR family transcriptional regulator [Endozoicomonas sp. OPT23]